MTSLVDNIEISLYRIVINVYIAKNCGKAVKLSKKLSDEFYGDYNWSNTYGCYIYSEKNNIHAIALAGDADIDTIAHECFHATMGVLQCTGMKFSEDSEECFPYVHGFIVKEVYELMKEFNEK